MSTAPLNRSGDLQGPLVEGKGLHKRFGPAGKKAAAAAVDDVSLHMHAGERVGLVGESGSGKSTLGRMLLRLEQPSAGRVFFDGVDITDRRGAALLPVRRQMQIVFQDPSSSLNPRMSVLDLVAEGLIIHGLHGERGSSSRRERVLGLLAEVGLDDGVLTRRPHELSGGQKQRVGIARALAVEPRFLLLDEPVSALDVSVQAQIINLLAALSRRQPGSDGQQRQEGKGLAMLFVAHDLHVVRHLCERVIVMKDGRVVEQGATQDVFAKPQHPYTQALLAAVPVPDPSRRSH